MGIEIERRFRVNLERLSPNGEDGKPLPKGNYFKQGYLALDPSVRIRLKSWDEHAGWPAEAVLTIKGKGTVTRQEVEFVMEVAKGVEVMDLVKFGVVEKVRYKLGVPGQKRPWELDRFLGAHEGLWLAELELDTEDQEFARPPWLGDEVTEDTRFGNAYLASHPNERFWA